MKKGCTLCGGKHRSDNRAFHPKGEKTPTGGGSASKPRAAVSPDLNGLGPIIRQLDERIVAKRAELAALEKAKKAVEAVLG